MGGKKVYKVAVCKVCGLTKRCNGGTCSACHSAAHCKVCRRPKQPGSVWCEECLAALRTGREPNYGGDLRPARERERVIARYARRAAKRLPLFGGYDRA